MKWLEELDRSSAELVRRGAVIPTPNCPECGRKMVKKEGCMYECPNPRCHVITVKMLWSKETGWLPVIRKRAAVL